MPYVGDPGWSPPGFRAWWDGESGRTDCEVTYAPESAHNFVARFGAVEHGLDLLPELLDIAPPGATVHCELGGVELELRRGEAPRSCLARASTIVRGERMRTEFEPDPELALLRLGALREDRDCPRCCFWCANSAYEVGTGFEDRGHLACFLADKADHDVIVRSSESRRDSLRIWRLRYVWVDELFSCVRWERRP